MGFIIKNNFGPNIEVNEGGVVHFQQSKDGVWQTVEAEVVDMKTDDSDTHVDNHNNSPEELNFFAPKKNLQELLKKSWFADVRGDKKYDTSWTDSFIEALMDSNFGKTIAEDWGKVDKCNKIQAHIVGLLKDAGVLKGSYDGIASKIGIMAEARTFAKYMGEGKKEPYADWVKEYVNGKSEQ